MTRWQRIGAERDETGSLYGAIKKQVDALAETANKTTGVPITAPEIDLSFPPTFRRDTKRKGGIYVTLGFKGPGEMQVLVGKMVRTSDRTSQSAFNQAKFHFEINDITDDERATLGAGGTLVREIPTRLEYNTSYDIFRLIAFMQADQSDTNPPQNPALDVLYNDPALLTFTTPPEFSNVPSAPDPGAIIENLYDSTTKDAFDAFVVERVWAPFQSASPASFASCSITNNSAVITGTGFSGVVLAGHHVFINGITRKVTAVTNTQITCDLAFKSGSFTGTMYYGAAHTWDSAEITKVTPKNRLTTDSAGKALPPGGHAISSDEGALTYVDIRVPGLVAAKQYDWTRNVLEHPTGVRAEALPLSTVRFTAGNFTADTTGLPELTSPTWTYDPTKEPNNDTTRLTRFFVTQPGPPIALDFMEFWRRLTGTGTIAYTATVTTITGTGTLFLTEVKKGDMIVVNAERLLVQSVTDDTHLTVVTAPTTTASGQSYKAGKKIKEKGVRKGRWHPPAGGQITFEFGNIRTKKLASQDFVVILYAQSGNSREFVDNFTTGSTDDVAVPGALSSTVTLATNSIDGDPKSAQAHIGLTFTAANAGTFASNNISSIEIVMVKRNEANSADVGSPFSELKVLSTADLAATSATHEFFKKQGKRFRVTKIVARNGHQRTETGVTLDFIAGGLRQVDPADSLTVPAPTFGAITREDLNNKIDLVPFTIAQNGTDIIWFKELLFYASINSGSFKLEQTIQLDNRETLFASNSASYTDTIRAKRKAGVTAQYQMNVVTMGGKASALATSAVQGATTGDVLTDTAAPTLATNPVTGTTGPTVRERLAKIVVNCPTPSANINTLRHYQVVMSTQNTAPAGNPTVGSEGVLEIQYGQGVNFNIPLTTSITSGDLYFYFRVANEFNGGTYSVWSAGTNQHGYSRALQDSIGTAVPVLPMRLEANGTSPSAPAVANDATHYSISTGDSTDYQALISAGVVLHLHIPSLSSPDRIRKCTAYDTTNHRFTVDVAFGTTPGNNIAYEIHRGNTLGEKSGTGHTTTVINLGTAGAALASGSLIGYAIFCPSQPSADQIRRITAHSGSAITLDTATGGALGNNACYMICQGSFGYAAVNPLSGIIAPQPFRVWLNSDTGENIIELILPTGENSFSVNAVKILMYRKNNGVERRNFYGNITVAPSYPLVVPGTFTPVYTIQLQNLYRDGGSDGFSAVSYYVEGYASGATPGVTYDPATFVPVKVDIFDEDNYPTGRFNPL